jgi:hypothetical protein
VFGVDYYTTLFLLLPVQILVSSALHLQWPSREEAILGVWGTGIIIFDGFIPSTGAHCDSEKNEKGASAEGEGGEKGMERRG